jgi:hypothetical protein
MTTPPKEHELGDTNQVAAAEEAFSYPIGNGNDLKLWCVSITTSFRTN